MTGRVFIVGAGPGDPGLLTRRAAACLRKADLVLFDALVDERVVRLARRAQRFFVGKRAGRQALAQEEIQQLMVRAARRGKTVVRLKGGDPFVFGRGGEEKTHLEAQGIAVEVIPGVTAGVAAPGSVGVPVTHRDVTPGCIFVTGHEKRGGPPIDWRALAATGLTLVIYMGVSRAARIRDELLAGGLASDLPAVVIQNASLPDQRAVLTTLGRLPEALAVHAIKSPAVMVIGEVAKFADVAVRVGLPRRRA